VPGVLLGFFEGAAAVAASRRTPAERRAPLLRCLVDLFGPRAAAPTGYVERDWTAEEWTRGCYGGAPPPGVLTRYGPALRAPVGPLHWAGAETATRWAGYMDGAVQSGERVAVEIVTALAAAGGSGAPGALHRA
jgi:monoamine oxidase